MESVKFYLQQIINEGVGQSWTIFGLMVGWIVLPEGETKDFVGITLVVLTLIWAATMPLRIDRHGD